MREEAISRLVGTPCLDTDEVELAVKSGVPEVAKTPIPVPFPLFQS